MKRFILGVLTLIVVFTSNAQDQKQQAPTDSLPFDIQKNAFIYSIASRYSDIEVSRMALYNILAYNPNNVAILDSLALMYVDNQQYASAVLASQDALRINPNDLLATEIAAVSFENLGLKDRSITYYETLYLDNQNITTLYKIAFMQFDLKRFGEALNSADILIASSETAEKNLIFQKNQNQNQEVSMLAAAYRLKGMVEAEKGNIAEAKAHFEKALEVAPDFVIVKYQLEQLDKG